MGTIIRGRCQCGFDTKDVFAGGGFVNFMDTCNAPAVCLDCGEFLVRNYINRNNVRCPGCNKLVTFYDDPSVFEHWQEAKEHDYLFTWRIADKDEFFKLPDARFLCPKCKKMTLIFEDRGKWD